MTKPRKIAVISVLALLVIALVVALAFASSYRTSDHCTGFEVCLLGETNHLLTIPEVSRFMRNRHLDPQGLPCDSVNLANIEEQLLTMPLVRTAECCLLRNGLLHIDITPRHPLFRVRTSVSDYCIDADGTQMLTPANVPDSIISVTGDVTIQSALADIYPLVRYLYSQPRLASEFRSIHVGRGNQVSLRSNRCSYTVVIGNPARCEQSLEKLQRFRHWDSDGKYQSLYKTIDLQFRGQIVCKRKQ